MQNAIALALFAWLFFSSSTFVQAAGTAVQDDQLLAERREAFRLVYPQAEMGNWQPALQQQLDDYVLWPDLRAAWFRATLKSAERSEIEAFLDLHGTLKPARELRYQYALRLAANGELAQFLSIYQQYYQGLGVAKLDCLALQAEIAGGRENRVVTRGLELWMVGASQADECDPVFDNLKGRGLLTTQHFADRFKLAVDAKRFTLARYLSKNLAASYREEAEAWLQAQRDPAAFIAADADRQDKPLDRRQLAYAIRQLAFTDPSSADRQWQRLQARFSYATQDTWDVSRHIALWSARLRQPQSRHLLNSLASDVRDVETGRWLVRANLLAHQWAEVIRSIDALPAAEGAKSEWQYWKAVAHGELGQAERATLIFAGLAHERSYHGFLAADAVGASYALSPRAVDDDAGVASQLDALPELVRARELFFVGLESRGRSEWDAAVSTLSYEQQLQAALLAHRIGWHSRAISTIATAGHFDDLQLRYPLPWREDFTRYAKSAGITDSWAYGVARSESLFMRDIRSSAGAIGVMQLMPQTGRETAREIQLPFAGLPTLVDSASNIRLGTHYLGKMYSRFDNNRVLATAAYNAGPVRVDQWLPESGTLDARIWIANIPFNETRDYVRRVLADEAIFHWRLTGAQRRLSAGLPMIVASGSRASTAN